MNVLSLFDGMSCGQIALERAGIPVTNYFASEIDKYAIQVTQANFPNTIQVGDVRSVRAENLPKIDLLIGGSPCQGFSTVGTNQAFNDPRSALFFEYLRILQGCAPTFSNIKNVRMKKIWESFITWMLRVDPLKINSALVSAQTRKRLYWTNIPGITSPKDQGQYLKDILETGTIGHTYYFGKPKVPFIQDIGTSVGARLVGRYLIDGIRQDGRGLTAGLTRQYIECRKDAKTNALTTRPKDAIIVPFYRAGRHIAHTTPYRNPTPLEYERLQTVPDNYTNHVSNTQRYKMIGNGWTVDVIAHILRGLPYA